MVLSVTAAASVTACRKPDPPPDPRLALLRADEAALLSQREGGNEALSRAVRVTFAQYATESVKIETVHVFTRRRAGDGAVLALVLMPTLDDFRHAAREQMLRAVAFAVHSEPGVDGAPLYVGVRSVGYYGVIQTPQTGPTAGGNLDPAPLLSFYDPAPATRPATAPVTAPSD